MPELTEAAERYGVTAAEMTPLGAFESDVYSFEGPNGPSILKVIAEEHRSAEQVMAEVEWLLALNEVGVPVAEPLTAVDGAFVSTLSDPTRVLVAFRRAPGVTTRPPDWTDARLESWGEVLGRLHAHSRSWSAPHPRRGTLAEHTYSLHVAEVVPDDPAFVAAAEQILAAAAPLLTHGPGSGLIHADLHHSNMLLHEERWTAIDFDDCAYGSYAFDLAMPLYYAIFSERDVPADVAAGRFLPPFLRGFRRHAPDPEGGAEAVALSLTLRHAELVAALRSKLGTDLDGERWSDPYRRAERSMRQTVIEGRETLTVAELRRWLA